LAARERLFRISQPATSASRNAELDAAIAHWTASVGILGIGGDHYPLPWQYLNDTGLGG